MKLNFCTLFNSHYLTRGLVMYESLLATCPDFHLYVLAFDDDCYRYLEKQSFEKITVISLADFENENLLRVKPGRTKAEYCWTCTPSSIHYCMKRFQLTHCTYIDADLCFYSDPSVLIDEMGDKSVLITEHRYSPAYEQSLSSGKYCVQFMAFKNTPEGMEVLNWWKDACIEWCYNRFEDGKFGDQKYLDNWLEKYPAVHNLSHPGGGVAPWNVQQYSFSGKENRVTGTEISTGKTFPLVFFHFHGMQLYTDDMVYLTYREYDLDKKTIELLYIPYIVKLKQQEVKVKKKEPGLNPSGATSPSPMRKMGLRVKLFYYLYDLRRSVKNIFGKNLRHRTEHHYYYKISDFQ